MSPNRPSLHGWLGGKNVRLSRPRLAAAAAAAVVVEEEEISLYTSYEVSIYAVCL